MKIALSVAALLFVGLMGFYFRDRLIPDPRVRLSRVTSDFDSVAASLKSYKVNAGHYPSTEQGLAALITRPGTEPQPNKWVQLLKKLPPDPWDQPYRYRALPEDDKRGFEVISAGKDGVFGTNDDLSSLDHE